MSDSKDKSSSPDPLAKASAQAPVSLTEEELKQVAAGGDGSVFVASKFEVKLNPTTVPTLNFLKIT